MAGCSDPASFRPCNKQYSTAFITDGAGSWTACVGGVRFDDFGRRKLVAPGSRYAPMPSASFGEFNRIAVRIMSSHRTLPGLFVRANPPCCDGRRLRWRPKASRVHPLALSGKQSVQLAHLALVPGASAFGPNVVMHGVKGDGELHSIGRRLQLNDSGDFVGRDARHEIGQSLIGQSAWR